MENVLGILLLIIAIPILCDLAFKESHICKTVLESIPLYRKLVAFIDAHSTFFGWLLFIIILFVIYPICFNCGYSTTQPINHNCGYSYILTQDSINNHPNPFSIAQRLKNQIYNNDSLFIVRYSLTDSVVFNRKSLKLERKSASVISLSDYDDRYENCNQFERMVLGALVIPSWKEVKSNLSFSSNGKKGWIICCLIAGYFGYHQGVKCKQTELSYADIKEWIRIHTLLNDENWWIKLANSYPYQKDKYVIVEDHPYGYGVGIGFKIENSSIVVDSVYDNSPAQKVGITSGDRIVSIDNINSIENIDTSLFVWTHLRGRKGTSVKLGIQRDSNDIMIFNLDREPTGLHFGYLIDEPIIKFE